MVGTKNTTSKVIVILLALIMCLSSAVVLGSVKVDAAATLKASSYDYNAVKLTWGKTVKNYTYNVYRTDSKSKDAKFTRIVKGKKGTGGNVSYVNTGLVTGKTYYYKVYEYNKSGKLVKKSNLISCTPKLKTPKITYSSSINTSGIVHISIGIVKPNGATGYQLLKSSSKDGTYKVVKSGSYAKGETAAYYSFIPKKGSKAWYKARVYRKTSSGVKYSNYTNPVNLGA